MHRAPAAVALSLLAILSCSSEKKPPSAEAKPAEGQPAGSQTAAKPAEAPRPPPALATTAADRLGTAPEGLGLPVGAKAPDATLADVTGKEVSLAQLYAQGPTLVVFYRGGWCPFCNLQLHDLTKAKPKFDAKNVKLAAISVDLPGEEAKTQAKHDVPFPMLSDPKLVAHQGFHVVKVNTAEEKERLAGFGVDLRAYSGEGHGNFAVPSIFLIDASGVVRWAHVDPDYKTRPSPDQLLAVLDQALAAKQ